MQGVVSIVKLLYKSIAFLPFDHVHMDLTDIAKRCMCNVPHFSIWRKIFGLQLRLFVKELTPLGVIWVLVDQGTQSTGCIVPLIIPIWPKKLWVPVTSVCGQTDINCCGLGFGGPWLKFCRMHY